ncbi:MAG: hypothetical protein ACKE51_04245 [Methylococcaceae bacterium]
MSIDSIEKYFDLHKPKWEESFFLEKLASKKKYDVRYSLLALQHCGTKKAIPRLKETVFHTVADIRAISIITIGIIGREDFTSFYIDLLNNPKYKDKVYVMWVISDFADETAVEAVLQFIEKIKKSITPGQDRNEMTLHATLYLNKFIVKHPNIKETLDFLISALPSSDGGIREKYIRGEQGLVLRKTKEKIEYKKSCSNEKDLSLIKEIESLETLIYRDTINKKQIKLEEQIQKLDKLGLHLNKNITVDFLLSMFKRDVYENAPYNLVLNVMGMNQETPPYDQPISLNAWNFVIEEIEGTGDYVSIVKKLCELSGNPDYLINITDCINLEEETVWLKYKLNGLERYWTADTKEIAVDHISILLKTMKDIERGEKFFYCKKYPNTTTFFFLNNDTAKELVELGGNLYRAIP